MKKLIAILTIMIVLVGAVFAATGDKLLVTSTVDKHIPGYKIYGSEDTAYDIEGVQEPAAANTIASSKDISIDSITVNCKVVQYSVSGTYTSTKCKYKGTATIAVEASALSFTDTDNAVYSTPATATVATSGATTVPTTVTGTTAVDGTKTNKVNISYVYAGSTVQDSAVYSVFSFTWAADDTLVPGDYSATITMTYSTT